MSAFESGRTRLKWSPTARMPTPVSCPVHPFPRLEAAPPSWESKKLTTSSPTIRVEPPAAPGLAEARFLRACAGGYLVFEKVPA